MHTNTPACLLACAQPQHAGTSRKLQWQLRAHSSLWMSHHPASGCRKEAAKDAAQEPILSSFLYASVLSHDTFEMALAAILANRLSDPAMMATELIDIFHRCSNGIHWTALYPCITLWLFTIYMSV